MLIVSIAVVISYISTVRAINNDWYSSLCMRVMAMNRATPCGKASYSISECACRSDTYQQTLFKCIYDSSMLLNDGHNTAIKDSWQTIEHQCSALGVIVPSQSSMTSKISVPGTFLSFQEANSTADTKVPYSISPKVLEQQIVHLGRATKLGHMANYNYGLGRIGYIFGVLLLATINNFLSWFCPSLIRVINNSAFGRLCRKHIFLPPFIGDRRAQPRLLFRSVMQWCVPVRVQALLIIGYVILTVVLLAVNLDARAFPGTRYSTYSITATALLGSRTGNFAALEFPLLVLFAGRNNFLIWLTGWDQSQFLVWHRWIARIFTAVLGIHAISYSLYIVLLHDSLAEVYTEKWFYFGFLGLIGMFLACMTGFTRTIREKAYDMFLVTHDIFAIVAVLGTWYHLVLLKEVPETVYAVVAIWGFDRVLRVLRILANNPLSTCIVTVHEGDILELSIYHSGLWKPTAGNFVFIHFMSPLHFWQSHPFTVVEPATESSNGAIKLYAHARKGFTHTLLSKGNQKWRVWIDGPYGCSFNTKPYKELVLIAGGIGITAVDSHLNHLLKQRRSDQQCFMHWVMPDETPVGWFKHELKRMFDHNVQVAVHVSQYASSDNLNALPLSKGREVLGSTSIIAQNDEEQSFHEAKSSLASPVKDEEKSQSGIAFVETETESLRSFEMFNGRPCIDDLVKDHIANSQGPICFFVCGPGSMTDAVRNAVANHLSDSPHYVQFYEESFLM